MANLAVGRVIDLFLAHLADSTRPATRSWYEAFLREFRLFAGERQLRAITPATLSGWIARRYGESTPSTQHAAGRVVCRLVNWAVDEGHLAESPLRRFKKPSPSSRERVITGVEYAQLIKAAEGPIRDAVKFLWHTGARPQEFRAIRAEWINERAVRFPQEQSKGRKKRRVLYLDSMATAIAQRQATKHPTGTIFRDRRGKPWSREALGRAFLNLRKEAGVPGICAYTLRHTWITRMLMRGVTITAVAALAGNSPKMIMDVYSHVAENEDYLREHLR